MSEVVVQVSDLGKEYELGQGVPTNSLRERMMELLARPWRMLARGPEQEKGSGKFWALKDLSFEVREGTVVGLIGRNGAGKSTLLKVLSRITEPTTGEARIHGRIGSLLEVGTGFHPELTGRENVYLNGAILGMTRREIQKKFDEIVAFAGVEQFIDTPVKRYSSGMHVRLGFAVAAHLEPEILIVDEVLAVGDADFQRRCITKMQDISKSGKTIFLVSHNLAVVQNLCTHGLVLENGKLGMWGPVEEAIQYYLSQVISGEGIIDLASRPRSHGYVPVIRRLECYDEVGRQTDTFPVGSEVKVCIHYEYSGPLRLPYFGVTIETAAGTRVYWFQTRLQQPDFPDELPASGCVTCVIPRLMLVPGSYTIMLGCGSDKKHLDLVPQAGWLHVTEKDVFGTGRLPLPSQALVVAEAHWRPGER